MSNESKNRIAAIVIHGIGEQKPMSTMSDFVKSFLAYEEYKGYVKPEQNYFSAPEEIEGSFETQRWIVMPTKYHGKKDPNTIPYHSDNHIPSKNEEDTVRPMTDFYELYWAPLMNDNKFSHVIPWLFNIIRSENKPKGIKALLRLVFCFMVILFFAAVLSSIGIYDIINERIKLPLLTIYVSDAILTIGFLLLGNLFIKVYRKLLVPGIFIIGGLAIYGVIVLVQNIDGIYKYIYWGLFFSVIINGVFYKFSVNLLKEWLADAARYFNPTPDNVAQRDAIRNKGVELLETLAKKDKYDRVIVVAHSLGSAIGYDILRLYWAKHNKYYQVQENVQTILQQMDFIDDFDASDLDSYQKSQFEGFNLLKSNNIDIPKTDSLYLPWLVSDFITLGSPLSKFTFLLTDADEEKKMNAINERTMVTNPPVKDPVTDSYFYKHKNGPRFHHGALFAFTRWTNIFHENDDIGGTIDTSLGKGVVNHKIDSQMIDTSNKKKLGFLKRIVRCVVANSTAMHNHYWYPQISRDDSEGIRLSNPIHKEIFETDLAFPSMDKIYKAMNFNDQDSIAE